MLVRVRTAEKSLYRLCCEAVKRYGLCVDGVTFCKEDISKDMWLSRDVLRDGELNFDGTRILRIDGYFQVLRVLESTMIHVEVMTYVRNMPYRLCGFSNRKEKYSNTVKVKQTLKVYNLTYGELMNIYFVCEGLKKMDVMLQLS